MAEALEIDISVDDLSARRALRGLGDALDSLKSKVGGFALSGAKIAALTRAFGPLRVAAFGALRVVDKVGVAFLKLPTLISNLVKKLFTLQGQFAALATTLGVGFSLKGIASTGALVESLSAQFEFLFDSALLAKEEYAKVIEFTKTTPFEIPQLAQSVRDLQQFGLLGQGTLKTLSEVAVSAQVDVTAATEAFVSATNRIFRPLKQFGVLARQEGDRVVFTFKDKYGQIQKIVSDNNQTIIAKTVEAIFNAKYEGALDRFEGLWVNLSSNLSDAFFSFKNQVADTFGVLGKLKAVAGASLTFLDTHQELLAKLANVVATSFKSSIDLVTTLFVTIEPLFDATLTVIDNLQDAIGKKGLLALLIQGGIAYQAFGTKGLAAYGGLIAGQEALTKSTENFRKTFVDPIFPNTFRQPDTGDLGQYTETVQAVLKLKDAAGELNAELGVTFEGLKRVAAPAVKQLRADFESVRESTNLTKGELLELKKALDIDIAQAYVRTALAIKEAVDRTPLLAQQIRAGKFGVGGFLEVIIAEIEKAGSALTVDRAVENFWFNVQHKMSEEASRQSITVPVALSPLFEETTNLRDAIEAEFANAVRNLPDNAGDAIAAAKKVQVAVANVTAKTRLDIAKLEEQVGAIGLRGRAAGVAAIESQARIAKEELSESVRKNAVEIERIEQQSLGNREKIRKQFSASVRQEMEQLGRNEIESVQEFARRRKAAEDEEDKGRRAKLAEFRIESEGVSRQIDLIEEGRLKSLAALERDLHDERIGRLIDFRSKTIALSLGSDTGAAADFSARIAAVEEFRTAVLAANGERDEILAAQALLTARQIANERNRVDEIRDLNRELNIDLLDADERVLGHRLASIQQELEARIKAARGNDEIIGRAIEASNRLTDEALRGNNKLIASIDELGASLKESLVDGLGNAFSDLIDGTKSFKDTMLGLLGDIGDKMTDTFVNLLVDDAIEGLQDAFPSIGTSLSELLGIGTPPAGAAGAAAGTPEQSSEQIQALAAEGQQAAAQTFGTSTVSFDSSVTKFDSATQGLCAKIEAISADPDDALVPVTAVQAAPAGKEALASPQLEAAGAAQESAAAAQDLAATAQQAAAEGNQEAALQTQQGSTRFSSAIEAWDASLARFDANIGGLLAEARGEAPVAPGGAGPGSVAPEGDAGASVQQAAANVQQLAAQQGETSAQTFGTSTVAFDSAVAKFDISAQGLCAKIEALSREGSIVQAAPVQAGAVTSDGTEALASPQLEAAGAAQQSAAAAQDLAATAQQAAAEGNQAAALQTKQGSTRFNFAIEAWDASLARFDASIGSLFREARGEAPVAPGGAGPGSVAPEGDAGASVQQAAANAQQLASQTQQGAALANQTAAQAFAAGIVQFDASMGALAAKIESISPETPLDAGLAPGDGSVAPAGTDGSGGVQQQAAQTQQLAAQTQQIASLASQTGAESMGVSTASFGSSVMRFDGSLAALGEKLALIPGGDGASAGSGIVLSGGPAGPSPAGAAAGDGEDAVSSNSAAASSLEATATKEIAPAGAQMLSAGNVQKAAGLAMQLAAGDFKGAGIQMAITVAQMAAQALGGAATGIGDLVGGLFGGGNAEGGVTTADGIRLLHKNEAIIPLDKGGVKGGVTIVQSFNFGDSGDSGDRGGDSRAQDKGKPGDNEAEFARQARGVMLEFIADQQRQGGLLEGTGRNGLL